MNNGQIVIAALPIGGLSGSEAASRFTRSLRAAHPEIDANCFLQHPFVDGGEGTIDLLVTNTLGSFLEVEATGSSGEQLVVPLGFAGDDGKLAVIEMHRVAASRSGEGTSYGVGELILDSLDEGAFSILLGQAEPLAADAGFGAAQALGVKFFDKKDKEVDVRTSPLKSIARIDPIGRAFQLLSSRFFVAQTATTARSSASQELYGELSRLAEIIRRDVGIPILPDGRSASALEFGLEAFLSAKVQDGMALVLEATGIQKLIDEGQCGSMILLAESVEDLNRDAVVALLKSAGESVRNITIILGQIASPAEKKKLKGSIMMLADANVFAAPLTADATQESIRRDTLMRIEKLASQIKI
jgi:glycerate 2-kinase